MFHEVSEKQCGCFFLMMIALLNTDWQLFCIFKSLTQRESVQNCTTDIPDLLMHPDSGRATVLMTITGAAIT